MPKIASYDANVNPEAPLPGRSPERLYAEPDAFGGGNGLSTAGAGVADAADTLYTAEQRDEVSSNAANMATLRGKLTAQFATQSAENAGKPGFTDKFMADATNQIQALGGTYQTKAGQQAFTRDAASLTADMLEKSTLHNVAVAGAKAVSDFHVMVNQNAGTLFNDPTQAGSIFKNIDSTFSDPNGPYANVPAAERGHLQAAAKESLAIAAARGVVRESPELAEKLYNKGGLPGQSFLTESGNAQITSYIQTAESAERAKKALALAQQEHAQTMAAEADGNAVLKNIVKNPTDPGITDQILNSRMKWQQKETMLNIAMHTGAGDGHDQNTYGAGFFNVYQQIHQGKITSPDQLYSRVGPQGDLTVAGVDRLTNEIVGKRTPDGQIEAQLKDGFVKAMSQQLSGTNELLHLRDPNGDTIKQNALAWFLPAYEKAKSEGKYTDTQLLTPSDPHSLWAGVMRFKRSPNQMMQDLMVNNPGADLGNTAAAKPAKTVSFGDLKK